MASEMTQRNPSRRLSRLYFAGKLTGKKQSILLLERDTCSDLLVAPAHCAINEGVRGEQGDHQRLHAAIVIDICLMGFL